uniref:HPS5 TPR domain-containing protein n=1 Tax=Chrysemys picta bellii TaxID=8478 RepID=A0A8C3FHD8_CHRPI
DWLTNTVDILLLFKLPTDFVTKEKMADIFPGTYATLKWPAPIHLGLIPETVEGWNFLPFHLAQSHSTDFHCHGTQNGNTIGNGSTNWSNCITVENVALLLAKECGLTAELSERFTRICEILRIAEKRQSDNSSKAGGGMIGLSLKLNHIYHCISQFKLFLKASIEQIR